jgi:carbamoylphosphate synthase large subunit
MLGDNISSTAILQIAKRLGAYTIAVDNNPDSDIKKIADKSYSVSTADIDGLVKLAKSENINAVMAGVSEFNIEKALTVSELLGLPFYTTREQWNTMSNKENFKEVCRKFNIPVADEFYLNAEFTKSDLEKIMYPVIIKPVDSSASRGISVCKNENELRAGYEKALSYSARKEILIEKYLSGDQVAVYFTIQNGYISFSAMCDRYFLRQEGVAPVPLIYIFPSKHIMEFKKNNLQKFRDMFEHLKVQNGFIFIQAFFKDGQLIPLEMGYRLSGSQADIPISAMNGVNPLEMLVRFSLSGEMSGWDLRHDDIPKLKKWACTLHAVIKPGKIKTISGLDVISRYPEVINITSLYFEGDVIDSTVIGTLKQVLFRIFFATDTKESLIDTIKRIQKELSVTGEDGENMLFDINLDEFDI